MFATGWFFAVTLLRVFLCPRRNRFSTPPTFNYRTGSIPGINKRVGETITTRFSLACGFEEIILREGEREICHRRKVEFHFRVFGRISPSSSSSSSSLKHISRQQRPLGSILWSIHRLALARNEKPSKWCVRLSQVRAVDRRRSSGRSPLQLFPIGEVSPKGS